MKTWKKFSIIAIGYGLIAGFTYLSSVIPTWTLVFAPANLVLVGVVQILTGYKTTTTT
jgi:xanthosine utilization system XapX-like protein